MQELKNMESWYLFLTVSIAHHLVTVLRQRRKSAVFVGVQYLPFCSEVPVGTLVIDVTHINALSLTLENGDQLTLSTAEERPETTTAACLASIISRSSWTKRVKFVTSLHFDVDNFVAVWSVLNPNLAIAHQRTLREVARVGDFRECRLDFPWQHEVLKLICWLHSEERRLFLKSYESKSNTSEKTDMGVKKFQHFLQLFASVLCDPEPFKEQWCAEYDRVTKEYAAVAALSPIVYSDLGCVVVKLPDPAHYYALFSTSTGHDIVFSMYRGNRYEVEMKYTSIVPLGRPVLPRLDMTPLAMYLNNLEKIKRSQRESTTLAVTITDKYFWHCDPVSVPSPMLRLESKTKNLQKAERYVHPFERPIYPSLIEPTEMQSVVISFLTYGYKGILPKTDFEMNELDDFNKNIEWKNWEPKLK